MKITLSNADREIGKKTHSNYEGFKNSTVKKMKDLMKEVGKNNIIKFRILH